MEFLSPEWIEALDAAARGLTLPSEVRLVIEHRVDDTAWHLIIGDGSAAVTPGEAPDPDASFSSSREVAAALATGERATTDAFMAGDLRIGGRLDVLIEQHRALASVDDCFADVRAMTTY